MRHNPSKLSIAIVWLTGTLALWYGVVWAYGRVRAWQFAPLYGAAVVSCAVCAFLQGCILKPNRVAASAALGWPLSGLTFLICTPDPVFLLSFGYRSDCLSGVFGFNDMFPYLRYHVFIFFLLVILALAVLASTHGASFRQDRNPLRLLWLVAIIVLLLSALLLGEHFLGVNW